MSDQTKKPISKARLAANQANAQKSTGPRTAAGKARSAANACQHGFTGVNFAIVRLEDPAEIDNLKADLIATYKPVNNQEMWAVERIALAQNSIFRAYRLESGLGTSCLNESLDRRSGNLLVTMNPEMIGTGHWTNVEAVDITRAQNRNYAFATGFDRFTQKSTSWSLLLRYQAQAQHNYRRAVEDLDRLRAMRDELAVEQSLCEQPPAQPSPLCTPFELNPFEFPHPNRPSQPNGHLRNEPNSPQPTETKPVINESASSREPHRVPGPPEPKAEG